MNVKSYRKKPVDIQAVQLTVDNRDEVLAWCNEGSRQAEPAPDGGLIIHTLEGDHLASVGDWIIRGIAGEYYPCKPKIFAATYTDERDLG